MHLRVSRKEKVNEDREIPAFAGMNSAFAEIRQNFTGRYAIRERMEPKSQ
jgi:hypothetical protein